MRLRKYNLLLVTLPILIFLFGFMSLLSTFPQRARAQVAFFVIGVILYGITSLIDYRLYKFYWKIPYFLVLVSLGTTVLLGEMRAGSTRWLRLGAFTFQPSEFAKIAVIITIAAFLTIQSKEPFKKTLLKLVLYILPVIVLVVIQPDLGTGLIILGVLVGILFYAGINALYFVGIMLAFGAISTPIWNLLKDYQKQRIIVFLNPSLDVLGSGYNVAQSLIAVGSGGLFGKGFGKGTQTHLSFLPAYWTDFIFAAISEEWGFIGTVLLLILLTLLCLSFIYVSYKSTDMFGSLLCIGVFLVFFFQYFINVGMNLGLLPVTGVPLPLVSYGGSSLISSFILLGISQSVWVFKRD